MIYNGDVITKTIKAYSELGTREFSRGLKVGQLAKRTGLTVRTLHYYDEIGLLTPSSYTESGHRLYTTSDIARLQQIVSLRQLGLSLEDIQECLKQDGATGATARRILDAQISRLREQIQMLTALCSRLQTLERGLRSMNEVSVDVLIGAIEEIVKLENHFTPEQMEEIRKRGEMLGAAHIREVEAEWPRLIAQVRDELDKGTDASDPKVVALATRWMELVREFSGGNPEIERVLEAKYRADPTVGRPDMDPRMLEYMAYVQKSLASTRQA